jgi:long-chain fatty acid transport protein
MRGYQGRKFFWMSGASILALVSACGPALAGGFAIGEQSTVFMGTASAGAAAGGSIGSMYWNPAATSALPGTNTESSYTLVLPNAEARVNQGPGGPSRSGEIGIDSPVGASYGSYQVSRDLWIGMAFNSPYGLATKPENEGYTGNILGQTTKLLTLDANPTLAYRIAPGVTIGAGVQIMWAQGKLNFNEIPGTPSTARFGGTDWAFGGTAGILLEPMRGTSIGLGYRSQMDLDLDGAFSQPLTPGVRYSAVGSLSLPELVTLSLRQDITPYARFLATIEWTNWSRFDSLDLRTNGLGPGGRASIDANWSDGWFYSVGGEYDYSRQLTLRGGVAYEVSPEDDASKRLPTIPDNNRVWLNIGASYKWSETLSLDVAYSHIFVQDGAFDRTSPVTNLPVSGTIDMSADLLSAGFRTIW